MTVTCASFLGPTLERCIADFGQHTGDGRKATGQTGLLLARPRYVAPLPAKTRPNPTKKPGGFLANDPPVCDGLLIYATRIL